MLLLKIKMAAIRLGFRGFYAFAVSRLEKNCSMDKQMIKDMLYGTIREMQDNNRYYYRSTVGVEYSHWRDEGEKQLAQMIKLISARVDQIERDSLRAASQKMLLDELGKDHT